MCTTPPRQTFEAVSTSDLKRSASLSNAFALGRMRWPEFGQGDSATGPMKHLPPHSASSAASCLLNPDGPT